MEICLTNSTKFRNDYPEWPGITISLNETIKQIIESYLPQLVEA